MSVNDQQVLISLLNLLHVPGVIISVIGTFYWMISGGKKNGLFNFYFEGRNVRIAGLLLLILPACVGLYYQVYTLASLFNGYSILSFVLACIFSLMFVLNYVTEEFWKQGEIQRNLLVITLFICGSFPFLSRFV